MTYQPGSTYWIMQCPNKGVGNCSTIILSADGRRNRYSELLISQVSSQVARKNLKWSVAS